MGIETFSSRCAQLCLSAFLCSALALAGCHKDNKSCSNDTQFCNFISEGEYDKTGPIIDRFLKNLDKNSSGQEKLEQLQDWLKCKRCVANVEILCNSCIRTNPPQSELKVWFYANGQGTEKILDILMGEPLLFRAYHD